MCITLVINTKKLKKTHCRNDGVVLWAVIVIMWLVVVVLELMDVVGDKVLGVVIIVLGAIIVEKEDVIFVLGHLLICCHGGGSGH